MHLKKKTFEFFLPIYVSLEKMNFTRGVSFLKKVRVCSKFDKYRVKFIAEKNYDVFSLKKFTIDLIVFAI